MDTLVYLEIKKIDIIQNKHKQIVWQSHGSKALKGLLTKQSETQKVFADAATYAHKNLKNIRLDTKWSLHKLWKFLKGGITALIMIPILAIVAGVAYFLLRRKMTMFTIMKTPEFVQSPAQVLHQSWQQAIEQLSQGNAEEPEKIRKTRRPERMVTVDELCKRPPPTALPVAKKHRSVRYQTSQTDTEDKLENV